MTGSAAQLGNVIATGSRSVVYQWGSDAVAKVPLASTPEGWIRYEAVYSEAIHALGAPVPRMLGIEVIEGREVSIFERITGQSMWETLLAHQSNAAQLGRRLGELHLEILALPGPLVIPTQFTRVSCKVSYAVRHVAPSIDWVTGLIPRQMTNALCHGDFHPKNIVLGPTGPVVVDWFDVSRGDPCGDVARSLILLSSGTDGVSTPADPLPGASSNVLAQLRDSYLETVCSHISFDETDLSTWRIIQTAARLAEGLDRGPLLDALEGERNRRDGQRSAV